MAEAIGIAVAIGGLVEKLAKVALLISEFVAVDKKLLIVQKSLQFESERLEFIRTELSRKIHLLDPCILLEIGKIVSDCQGACDQITVVVNGVLTRIEKKGRASLAQRFEWVFVNSELTKAMNDYRLSTQVSLTGVWNHLADIPLPPSPNSGNVSAMQSNEQNPDLSHSAAKPPCPTIRAKSSPPQIGEIPDGETSSSLRTSSEEHGSAGLAYGVVDGPQSAGPPTTISYKSEDHIWDDERNFGSFLALREIALSRRQGSGPDLKKL